MIRRLIQLFLGLALYGLSIGFVIRSGLGGNPWDVFHQGVSDHSGVSIGTVIILTGAAVLLLWVPLRQRPGIGTISNVFMIGIFADFGLWLLPQASSISWAWVMLITGILLNGIAGGAYIGAGLGPGPRDGLMTGLVKRTGGSVRLIRTSIELLVLAIGWMLGGTAGVGTVIYALAIGPIVHRTLPFFTIPDNKPLVLVSCQTQDCGQPLIPQE
ncbi:membrane protein YczE [Altererythrobacter sp. Z27]|uniref:membrane protein YczE n=1 Tax=Altererythrobacter sp. Z27 TaxID=3461147 RepID=UPI0040447333